MSRYQSLGKAIEIMEACRKLFGAEEDGRSQVDDVIEDLRDMSKDVRYGSQWQEYRNESVARALDYCAEPGRGGCSRCKYHGEEGCTAKLKRDAANAIRSMGKRIAEMEKKMAEDREAI